MATFLFWNLGKRNLVNSVSRMAAIHSVDIVILAEAPISPGQLQSSLSVTTSRAFHVPWNPGKKLMIATGLGSTSLANVFDEPTERLTIRRLLLESSDVLIAAVHLPSKAYMAHDSDRLQVAQSISRHIRAAESEFGHRRTILAGDFNMDPYEHGLVGAYTFHALMTRRLVERGSRTVQHEDHPFFYNPMWGLFGDRTPGPAGTYFYNDSLPTMFYWHMHDQVLIRPDLLPSFGDDIRILDSDGVHSLVDTAGRPDKEIGSDHLRILFRMNL